MTHEDALLLPARSDGRVTAEADSKQGVSLAFTHLMTTVSMSGRGSSSVLLSVDYHHHSINMVDYSGARRRCNNDVGRSMVARVAL